MRLFHRVLAAFLAISDRFFADSLAALALPPLRPPRRPSSTARGSFGFSPGLASTVVYATMLAARRFGSDGARRFGGLLERSGMAKVCHSYRRGGSGIWD